MNRLLSSGGTRTDGFVFRVYWPLLRIRLFAWLSSEDCLVVVDQVYSQLANILDCREVCDFPLYFQMLDTPCSDGMASKLWVWASFYELRNLYHLTRRSQNGALRKNYPVGIEASLSVFDHEFTYRQLDGLLAEGLMGTCDTLDDIEFEFESLFTTICVASSYASSHRLLRIQ